MHTTPIHLTEAAFRSEVAESAIPVVVDFWAPWCGPCRTIGPILDELASRYAGQVKVAKINVDDEPSLAGRFRIRGIPTLIVFEKGESTGQVVGFPGHGPLDDLFAQLASGSADANATSVA